MVSNPVFGKGVRTGKLDTVFLFKINVFLCLSEKEVSELVFPNVDGKLEYNTFKSENALNKTSS
jgi:hypothetical protein